MGDAAEKCALAVGWMQRAYKAGKEINVEKLLDADAASKGLLRAVRAAALRGRVEWRQGIGSLKRQHH